MTLDSFHLYNLLMGLIATAGLIYVLYLHRSKGRYDRFVFVTVGGILIFAVVGPLMELIYYPLVHVIHGIAAIFIILGLYDPVHNDLRRDQWAELLLEDPSTMRDSSEWMVPMDDQILELFHTSDLVLTPAIIAYNIDYSREEVNRRLSELEGHGLVERVERGKYRISPLGEAYLHGQTPESVVEREAEQTLVD